MASEYTCTLDGLSLKKAETELNEDGKQRMSAVETLKNWLKERRTWINVPMDTSYLLSFLRMKKFNQIATRESLVQAWELRSKFPQWFSQFDPADPKILAVLSTGYYYPLPRRDKQGRTIVMMKCGNTSNSGKDYKQDDIIRGFITLHDSVIRDENVQVNGYVYFMDLGGFTMGHVTYMGPERFIKATNCWMKAHCGRNKELHFYNGGAMFDVLYGFLSQSFSKKIQDRVINHGNNLSQIYKYIDKSLLPDEYLPDDYNGPSAGPTEKIVADYITSVTTEENRKYLAELSNGQYFVDSSKKPKTGEEEVASFRAVVH